MHEVNGVRLEEVDDATLVMALNTISAEWMRRHAPASVPGPLVGHMVVSDNKLADDERFAS